MAAHRFQIVVEGELGDRYASAFQGMTVHAHDGLTDLTGSIVDQADMQGLLARIAGLGLAVHSLTPLRRPCQSGRYTNQPESAGPIRRDAKGP
jgi:hypothetical protein